MGPFRLFIAGTRYLECGFRSSLDDDAGALVTWSERKTGELSSYVIPPVEGDVRATDWSCNHLQ